MSGKKMDNIFKPYNVVNLSCWDILLSFITGTKLTFPKNSEFGGSVPVSLDLLKMNELIKEKKFDELKPFKQFKSSKLFSTKALVNLSFEELSNLKAKTINGFHVTNKISTEDNELKKKYKTFLDFYYMNSSRFDNVSKRIEKMRIDERKKWETSNIPQKVKDKDKAFNIYVMKRMEESFRELMLYYLNKRTDVLYKKRTSAKEDKPRLILYKEGFSIDDIHYRNYKRSASKAKTGNCVFIADCLYEDMYKWTWLGLELKANDKYDLTSLKAYEALVMSSIIGTVDIPNPRKSILMLDSIKSPYINGSRKILTYDENNKEPSLLTESEYENKYKKFDSSNKLWDGQALLDESLFTGDMKDHGMMLLRNSFFKACAFNTKITKFFKDKKIDEVTDMFGRVLKAKDIRLIVTIDSFKLSKFEDDLKIKSEKLYKHWLAHIDKTFGIVKQESPSILGHGNYHEVNYQILNTLPLSKNDMKKLMREDLDYIEYLKNDRSVMLHHLRHISQSPRKRDFIYNMLKYSPDFDKTEYYKNFVQEEVKNYKEKMKHGRLKLRGDMYTLCSMPYEMLCEASNIPYKPQLKEEEAYIQGLSNSKELVLFRNPHMNSGSVNLVKTKGVKVYDEYFNFTGIHKSNIIVVSPYNSNIMAILGGADFDSDTVLAIEDETIRNAALKLKKMTRLHPETEDIPISQTDGSLSGETDKKPFNDEEIAVNDRELSTSAFNIGKISNDVQVFNSVFWDNYFSRKNYKFLLATYDCILKLSILNELEIDKSKHKVKIDLNEYRRKIRIAKYNHNFILDFQVFGNGSERIAVPSFLYDPSKHYTIFKRDTNEYWNCPVDQISVILNDLPVSARSNKTRKELTDFFSFDKSSSSVNKRTLKDLRDRIPQFLAECDAINSDKDIDESEKNDKRNKTLEEFLNLTGSVNSATMAELFKYAFLKYSCDQKNGKAKKGDYKYPALANSSVKYKYLGLLFAIGKYLATDENGTYHEENDPAVACIRGKNKPVYYDLKPIAQWNGNNKMKHVTIWGEDYVHL